MDDIKTKAFIGPAPADKSPEVFESEPRIPIYRKEKEEEGRDDFEIDQEIESGEMPIEVFEEEEGMPYLGDILFPRDEKEGFLGGDDIPHPWHDVHAADKEDIKEIDEFLKDEIERLGYKETTPSYEKVFKDLRKKIGLSKESKPSRILDKFLGLLDALKVVKKNAQGKNPEHLEKLLKLARRCQETRREGIKLYLLENFLK